MTATTEKKPARAYKDEFLAMRREGATYREIGERYNLTHEMVRQVLADVPEAHDAWKDSRKDARAERAAELAEWLEANGPVMRSTVLRTFGLSNSQLNALATEYRLPTHFILIDSKVRPRDYDEDAITSAIRRVWTEVQTVNPSAVGLAHATYEANRGPDDPSSALIISRYGWKHACALAAVPPGYATRPSHTYGSHWDDDAILDAVAEYVREAVAGESRPSYVGYDEWQRGRDYAPSGSHVRNRMRFLGLGTWPEIVAAALNRD